MKTIVVINPGSTSTKLAIYGFNESEGKLAWKRLNKRTGREFFHEMEHRSFIDDLSSRERLVKDFIAKDRDLFGTVVGVAGRGGLLKPLRGGVYRVNDTMIDDLVKCRYGRHASNMGALIAREIAQEFGVEAYIAYPVVVDEMDEIARYTGIPEIRRKSIFHALNHKSVAHRIAEKLGKRYEDLILIVAHLGGGITVGLHYRGNVVDVNNGLDGDGPFAAERAGCVPPGDFLRLFVDGRYTYDSIYRKLTGEGGLYAYIGTKDARILENLITGDNDSVSGKLSVTPGQAEMLVKAWAYQVAKHICALTAYCCGRIDAIIITGGLAKFNYFVDEIKRRVDFLGKIFVVPGEDEMEALARYTARAILGFDKILEYRGE